MNRAATKANRVFLVLAWCLLIFIVVIGLGCSKKEPPVSSDGNEVVSATVPEPSGAVEPNGAAVAPAEPNEGPVVVTVNGREIRANIVDNRVNLRMRQFGGQLANMPPQFATQFRNQIKQQVVDNLVAELLLDEEVAAANIEISDAQVVAEMEKTAAAQQPPITLDDFKARVEAQGGNFQDVKDEFRKGMGYRRIMDRQWAEKAQVTDEEAKTYYDEHPKEFQTPEQVRASHILIKPDTTDPNTDPNEAKIAAKAETEKLLAQIKDGADFAELAKAHSGCSSAAKGGDLDFFARGDMVPPFEDVAFAMKPGEMSDVVETKFGFHIIKVTDHKDASDISFDEAKADLLARLIKERKAAVSKEYIQSLREKATIVYPMTGGADANEPAPLIPVSPGQG